MNIKEFIICELKNNHYYPIYPTRKQNVIHVAMFFYNAFSHIYIHGTTSFIEKLKTMYKEGISFEMIELTFDNKKNLAYINEPYDRTEKEITPEIQELINTESTLELYHKNFLEHTFMTKENLFELLQKWKKLRDKNDRYILIYLDNQDSYNSNSFNSQQDMEQFITEHTQK